TCLPARQKARFVHDPKLVCRTLGQGALVKQSGRRHRFDATFPQYVDRGRRGRDAADSPARCFGLYADMSENPCLASPRLAFYSQGPVRAPENVPHDLGLVLPEAWCRLEHREGGPTTAAAVSRP